jgi:hypothetical protein
MTLADEFAALYEGGHEESGYTDCRYDDPDYALVAEVQVWTGPQEAKWGQDFDYIRRNFVPAPAPFSEA